MDDWEYTKLKTQKKFQAALMQIRAWINTNPRIVIILAVISGIMLIAGIAALATGNDSKQAEPENLVWYYDLNTDKLFKDKRSLAPPIKAPSGPAQDGSNAGVRAYVYKISDPQGKSRQVIGYLEKLAPNADKSAYSTNLQASTQNWGKGILVKRPEDTKWIPADSTEAKKIIAAFHLPDTNGIVAEPVPAQTD